MSNKKHPSGNPLDACVRDSLQAYFRDLDGTRSEEHTSELQSH